MDSIDYQIFCNDNRLINREPYGAWMCEIAELILENMKPETTHEEHQKNEEKMISSLIEKVNRWSRYMQVTHGENFALYEDLKKYGRLVELEHNEKDA
jgi:sugar diacid utilization regulator